MRNTTNDGSRINCPNCPKSFNTMNGLRGHIMQTHKLTATDANEMAREATERANQPLFHKGQIIV